MAATPWQPSERVLATFREELGERLERMRLARAGGDAPALRHEAHAIHGAAAQLGFAGAASVARAIEHRAEAGEIGPEADVSALADWLQAGCPAGEQPTPFPAG